MEVAALADILSNALVQAGANGSCAFLAASSKSGAGESAFLADGKAAFGLRRWAPTRRACACETSFCDLCVGHAGSVVKFVLKAKFFRDALLGTPVVWRFSIFVASRWKVVAIKPTTLGCILQDVHIVFVS
jgi:hypothetical protein